MSKKYKIILTALLVVSVSTMFLSWFGGGKGVQEIKGTIVLFNPITVICIAFALVGIWFQFKYNKILTCVGLCGICIMEIYYFLTWYLQTINNRFSLSTCFSMAYPEFYIGLGLSIITVIVSILFLKSNKHTEKV